MDRESSPAFAVLRASSKRLLLFIEGEIARQGGGPVTLRMDEFQVVGSRNEVMPGLSEADRLAKIKILETPPDRAVGPLARDRDAETCEDRLGCRSRAAAGAQHRRVCRPSIAATSTSRSSLNPQKLLCLFSCWPDR
jgi:hypothetical protein